MAEEKNRKKQKKTKPSALNIVKGVEGGRQESASPGKSDRRHGRQMSTGEYVKGILDGDRTILGKAITLIESNAPAHQDQAQEVLRELMPHTGGSIRVGITGTPGAGKSTFIETLGTYLTDRDHMVAVMAVDPTSSLTKGSILGDKTRMQELGRRPNAFIRPSPSGGTLGGVTRKTRETMMVFEAAGYDVLLVETIGVGQSEITVRSMVDFFLLIMIAGAGDELQGIKRGVMELADTIVINKADGDNVRKAKMAREEYARALHYLQPRTEGWATEVRTASAMEGTGIPEIWDLVMEYRDITQKSGYLEKQRRQQAMEWLHSMLREKIHGLFYNNEKIQKLLPDIEKEVLEGQIPVTQAALELLQKFENHLKNIEK